MIKNVLIIGAGTMGGGIAQWFAQQSIETYLCDNSSDQLDLAVNRMYASWDKLLTKKKFSEAEVSAFKQNIKTTNLASFNTAVDLVIEAVFENIDIKREIFQTLANKMPASTIFASNTSSFPISSIAKDMDEARKKQFVGIHFFNPATIMKLVEIIKTVDSEPTLISKLEEWFNTRGKKVAVCGEAPGFIVNRVARNFYGEAMHIAKVHDEEKFKEIDSIMKEVGGFKMGPFELMDLIGIDVNFSVTKSVWNAFYKEPRFAPHRLQESLVTAGKLGKKTKQGFYKYD